MSTDPHASGPEPNRPPAVPTGTVYGRGATSASVQEPGLFSRLHPAVTATIAAAVIGVSALGYLTWRSVSATEPSVAGGPPAAGATPSGPADDPVASSSPSPPTGVTLSAGTWSLESADRAGSYLRREDGLAIVETVGEDSDAADRREAALIVVPGLADPACFTFRTADGRYLRHYDFRLRFDEPEEAALFRADATFCAGTGVPADSVTLRSHNYPDRVIHHRQSELWLDRPDGTEGFVAAASFLVRSPLAP